MPRNHAVGSRKGDGSHDALSLAEEADIGTPPGCTRFSHLSAPLSTLHIVISCDNGLVKSVYQSPAWGRPLARSFSGRVQKGVEVMG